MTGLDDLVLAGALARLEAAATRGHRGPAAAVVVEEFTPAALARGAVAFTSALPPPRREAWRRSFTRTVFLVGRPQSLTLRYPAVHLEDGLAWYGPDLDTVRRPLSRMLNAYHGPAPVDVPPDLFATGATVTALVATGDVSTQDYLVHLHHLVAEATLRGLVTPADRIGIRHRPRLDGPDVAALLDPARAGLVETRISRDRRDPARPRLYAVLTREEAAGGGGERPE
jgi:Family of unknown function (DUF6182)